jgi:hypothetical protein
MRRFKKDNVELVKQVVLFTCVAIVAVIDCAYLILAAYEKVTLLRFQEELAISTIVLVLVLNIGQIVTYC